MANLPVNQKLLNFRWLAADLTLNLVNAPWLKDVLKIETLTTPNSTGANAVSAYSGAANGQTPGGTLTKLVQNGTYKLNSATYNGWTLPTAAVLVPPTISSLFPLSVAPGDKFNISGTNLLTAKYVLIGTASSLIDTTATTNSNIAVTVPLTAPAGSNVPVVVITEVGSAVVTTLTVTGAGQTKLAMPFISTPVSTTSTSAYYQWGLIAGADSYSLVVNNITYPLGNVNSYTVTNLSPASTIPAYLIAKDSTGNKVSSDPSTTVSATTATSGGAIAAPTNMQVSQDTIGALKSTWSPVANATGYDLQRASDAAFTMNVVLLKQNLTSTFYSDLAIATGSTYYYRTRTVYADGTRSAYGTVVSGVGPALNGVTLSSLGVLSDVADLNLNSTTYGSDQTAKLKQIFATRSGLIYWDVKCSFKDVLLLNPNTRVLAQNGGGFLLLPQAATNAIANANRIGWAVDGNGNLVEGTLGTIVDENIVLDGLVMNFNGRQQPHDRAPATTEVGGWTIGVNFAALRGGKIRNCVLRDQTTFCALISHFEDFEDDNNAIEAGSPPAQNTDGIKYLVGNGLRIVNANGATGDDFRSFMAADITFPSYPPPPAQGASQTAYYKYGIYGDVKNVQCGALNLVDSVYGLRIGSVTNDFPKVQDITIDTFTGTTQQHGLLVDVYEDKNAFYGPATGTRTGAVGQVRVKSWTQELSRRGYQESNITLKVVQDAMRLDYMKQTRFDLGNDCKIGIKPEARLGLLQHDNLVIQPTTSDVHPFCKVEGYVKDWVINAGTFDRSAFGSDNQSVVLVEMQPGGRIDKLTIKNLTSTGNYNLISIPNGSIGELVLENISAPDCHLIYAAAGVVVDKITANNCNLAGMLLGPGTVTTREGNYFVVSTLGLYEETASQIAATGNWQVSASNYHSGGACLLSQTAGDYVEVLFNFTQDVVFELISNNGGNWGGLTLSLDGQSLATVPQNTAPGAIRTTYTSATIIAGKHVLRATATTSGAPNIWDAINFRQP